MKNSRAPVLKHSKNSEKKSNSTEKICCSGMIWKICRSRRMSSHNTKGLVINRRSRTGSLEDFTKNFKKFWTLVHWSTVYFVYCYECTALTYFCVISSWKTIQWWLVLHISFRTSKTISQPNFEGLPSSGLQLQRFLWNLCGILII